MTHPLITAVSERRIGRFRIAADMLRTFPLDAHMLLRDVLVVSCEMNEAYATFDYVAFGPLFEPCNRGEKSKFYRAVINREQGKEPRLASWEKM